MIVSVSLRRKLAKQDNDYYLGGLSFSGTGLFNWHPILMIAGLVVAYTQGAAVI